jgi:hypothetical protein
MCCGTTRGRRSWQGRWWGEEAETRRGGDAEMRGLTVGWGYGDGCLGSDACEDFCRVSE